MKVCPTCTFINDAGESVCSMCRQELETSSSINCPVCGYSIPLAVAEVHVNDCLANTVSSSSATTSLSHKRSMDFPPPAPKPSRSNISTEKALTALEQIELYKTALQLSVSSEGIEELRNILNKLFSHMTAEKREEDEINSKGKFSWEYESRATRNSAMQWIKYAVINLNNINIE
jgi:hypothetical protein